MADENKELPVGWRDNDDDDDYNDSPWGNKASSSEEESVNMSSANDIDKSSIKETEDKSPTNVKNTSDTAFPIISENTVTKSKATTVLIIIIAVLVFVIGILAGMFFMQGKNDKSNNDSAASDSEGTPVETSASTDNENESTTITTIQTTENATERPTEEETEEKTTPTEEIKIKVSDSEIETARKAAIDRFLNEEEYAYEPGYALQDINGDGIPELFITYMDVVGSDVKIYAFKKSNYNELKTLWGDVKVCPSSHFIMDHSEEGADVYTFYELTENNQLTKIDEIYSGYDMNHYRNGQTISESEYYAALNYYLDMTWNSIDSTPINTGGNSGSNSFDSNSYDISTPGVDFTFYADLGGPASYGRTVATENDPLNLRAAPSSSAEIVFKIPKGAVVGEFAFNSEWSYVSYTENGNEYVGYVSSQFLK